MSSKSFINGFVDEVLKKSGFNCRFSINGHGSAQLRVSFCVVLI